MKSAILMIEKLANLYIVKRQNAVSKGLVSACWYGHASLARYMITRGVAHRFI